MSSTINTPFLHIPIPLPPLIWCPNVYQPVSNSTNTNKYIALFISVGTWSVSFNSRFTPHSIDDILRPDPRSLASREFKATESPLNLSLSKGKKRHISWQQGTILSYRCIIKDPINSMERETKDAKILTMKARIVGVGRTLGGKRCEQLLRESKYSNWKKVLKARSTCHRRRERRWLRAFRSLSSRQVTIQKFRIISCIE